MSSIWLLQALQLDLSQFLPTGDLARVRMCCTSLADRQTAAETLADYHSFQAYWEDVWQQEAEQAELAALGDELYFSD